MQKKKTPKSLRKFIRREKARIRREILDIKEQERLITQALKRAKGGDEAEDSSTKELCQKFFNKIKIK